MTIPPTEELSVFLGQEAQEIEHFNPTSGHHAGIAYRLAFSGTSIIWQIFPSLGYCQLLSDGDAPCPVEAFIKCDSIEINRDIEEEGGQCVVMKAKGWHACITPRLGNQLFFSIYGDIENLFHR